MTVLLDGGGYLTQQLQNSCVAIKGNEPTECCNMDRFAQFWFATPFSCTKLTITDFDEQMFETYKAYK